MLLVILSFSFLVLGWGGHYLVQTKESNIANNAHKRHNTTALEHGEDYESDTDEGWVHLFSVGSDNYNDVYDYEYNYDYRKVTPLNQGLDYCKDVCRRCEDLKECKEHTTEPNLKNRCCGVPCNSHDQCSKECPNCQYASYVRYGHGEQPTKIGYHICQ